MLVIMDMEWIENKTKHFYPTQISALRTDKNWGAADRFDALMRPFDASCCKWKHVAFHGASRDDFLNADPALRCLSIFWTGFVQMTFCAGGKKNPLVFSGS